MTTTVERNQQSRDADVAVQRNKDERTIVGAYGQYELASWRDANGKPREFQCRVVQMSSQAISISAPVTGTIGEWAIIRLGHLGTFEGPIIRTMDRGLVVRVVATADERKKIDSKIAWINDKTAADGRDHGRLVPRDPRSSLLLADGRLIECEVLDYSVSGAGVSAEITPEIGEMIKVGDVIGKVVRHFPGGFAVQFTVLQDGKAVEELVTRTSSAS
jgi:hypothetical protein